MYLLHVKILLTYFKYRYTSIHKFEVGKIFKMFLNQLSYAHQVCIDLIQKYSKTLTL